MIKSTYAVYMSKAIVVWVLLLGIFVGSFVVASQNVGAATKNTAKTAVKAMAKTSTKKTTKKTAKTKKKKSGLRKNGTSPLLDNKLIDPNNPPGGRS